MINDKWLVGSGGLSDGAAAKFLFLFKEKVSVGGSKNFQLQIIICRRMTEKVNKMMIPYKTLTLRCNNKIL